MAQKHSKIIMEKEKEKQKNLRNKSALHPHMLRENLSLFGFFYLSPPSEYSSIKFIPVFCTDDSTTSINELYLQDYDYQPTCLDSCKGLLLCQFLEASTNKSSYIVCNPTMRQQVLLPPLPSVDEGNAVFLAHGFVFVSVSNDYDSSYFEVIRVLQGQEGLIVSTFSSSTWTWRTKNHELSFVRSLYLTINGVGVRCNGSLHWLCLPFGVVAYNVKKEKFSLIKVPSECNGELLKESEGRLFHIEINKYYNCSAWVLEDYSTKRWCLKYLVDIKSLPLDVILPYQPEEIYSRILGFDPLDSRVVFVRINRRIVSYNLESCEVIGIHRLQEDEVERFDVCPYQVIMNLIPEECYSKVLRTPCGRKNGGSRSTGRLRFL